MQARVQALPVSSSCSVRFWLADLEHALLHARSGAKRIKRDRDTQQLTHRSTIYCILGLLQHRCLFEP